ncbi:MAG: cysteine desulfurase [Nitrospinaceae bacterium]|jgi:cysteine desulfurase|nr:cysteine desulfurase [Nitrospinaceae bacterium]MBT3432962.1 cysteine desulfurase [Nitrospinaceae bacterium]MBT3822772.1 cysteine desulfurase [Nitrospinaceae bacterium]MBT4095290.1 cysteine desulfurase [Nitrospinaceae bacterium]MBT4432195.1 cysteine desulfurase [Nitrospinaceae bacterium]
MTTVTPVYLDHNATTPVRPEVAEIINRHLGPAFGNPNSIHRFGRETRGAVEGARENAASLIGALSPEEIVFTSGGTESDNWALRGALLSAGGSGHIVTSAIEHPAVLGTCEVLEKTGVEVSYVKPSGKGRISVDEIIAAIRPDTQIVSVMWANNEVGTVQPISEIGAACREREVLFHTDAVQAAGKVSIDVEATCVDLLSVSGHKINASKGAGFLYIREGVHIEPIITGGGQERDLRSGTENVPGIAGLGEACRLAQEGFAGAVEKTARLRDMLENEILERIPDVVVNGDPDHRLPGTSNLGFLGAEGETMLIRLDLEGFAVSTGSACSSGSTEPSHVLLAMGLPKDAIRGSLRISLGWGNTEDDVRRLMEILPGAVERVRQMAPRTRAGSDN